MDMLQECLSRLGEMQAAVALPNTEKLRAMRNNLAPQIRDTVLQLRTTSFEADFDKTLVYGVQCDGYGEAEFEEDVQTVARRYSVPEAKLLRYMIKGSEVVPDEDAAFQSIGGIIRALNTVGTEPATANSTNESAGVLESNVGVDPVKRLRIVEAGLKETGLIKSVLKYMLKSWTSQSKHIQFVHVRPDDKMLLFWKDICLKGLCTSVDYVNRKDYTGIGTLE